MILLEGIFIGFLYALIPGGSILVGLNLALSSGFSRTAAFTYGVLLIDIVYAFLAVTAATSATDAYVRIAAAYPSLLHGTQLALVAALGCYGAYLVFRQRPMADEALHCERVVTSQGAGVSLPGYLLLGITLKLSTIASPSFLAGFALLTSQAGALGLSRWSFFGRTVFAMGFGLGNFLYLQTCMRLASRYAQRLRRSHCMRLQKLLGAVIALLGALILVSLLRVWMR
ncbi:MAG: hypothetical protein M5R41_07230 [Bacteroidia bacterium]|nr:hypothetical protein [Bacteroidia bacterium]